jgi:hypothetical protein
VGFKVGNQTVLDIDETGATVIESAPDKDVVIDPGLNGEVYIDDSSIASEGPKIVAVLGPTSSPTGDIVAYIDSLNISTNTPYIEADDVITIALQSYADTAEADAISASNLYTDGREAAITTAYQSYTDTAITNATFSGGDGVAASYVDTAEADAIAAANTYTDAAIVALGDVDFTGYAQESYVDTAEADAIVAASTDATNKADASQVASNLYTDGREAAITAAYQSYADAAEADAITSAYSDATAKAMATLASALAADSDTIYDSTAIDAAVALNTAKISNVDHPLVETAVPVGAVFTDTDTVYTHPSNHAISEVTGLQTVLDSKTTEAYVDTEIAALVATAPATLDTLNELADALGDDPNFATTITNTLAGKVNDSQVLTDVPTGALFTDTDTVYDSTAIDAAVALNTAKISNIDHPLVETAVPVGAVFTDTDTVYDDSLTLVDSDTMTPITPSNKLITQADVAGLGGGDMLKSAYDTNLNGIVDNAALVNGLTVETAVPVGAVFTDTDTVYDSTAIDAVVALNTAKVSNVDHPLVETAVPVGAVFTDTDTVYDSTAIDAAVALNTAKVSNIDHPLVETAVPVGAVFTDTDTVYDSTAIDAAVALNTAKVSNVDHPLVETAVPVGALFTDTDTIYDSTAIDAAVALNTAKVSNVDHPLVETAVPVGAVFTDTVYTHPSNHAISEVTGLQTALDSKTTEAYVVTEIAALVDSSPATLDTLNELAAALGDDPNFATTMTNTLAGKVDDSQVLTDVPSGALFTDTDTIYDSTAIDAAVALNTAKVSNVDHPLVETAVPVGALFTDTDTIYDSTAIDAAVALNTAKVSNSTDASDLTSGILQDSIFPAVLPAISGANLTNTGTADFVASGTLPNGSPVIFKADGTVEAAGINSTMVVYENTGYATPTGQATASALNIQCAPAGTNKILVTFKDSGNLGKAVVGTISGNIITFGTPVEFAEFSVSSMAMKGDPSTPGSFLVAYSSFAPIVIPGYWVPAVYSWVSTSLYIIYTNGNWTSGNYFTSPYRKAGLLDTWTQGGDTITRYHVEKYEETTATYYVDEVITVSETVYNAVAKVLTVSGTTVTVGTEVAFNNETSYSQYQHGLTVDPSTAGRFMVAYGDVNNNTEVNIMQVSGTSITMGTSVTLSIGSEVVAVEFNPHVAGQWIGVSKSSIADNYSYLGSVSGNVITVSGNSNLLTNTSSDSVHISFDPRATNAGRFVIAYRDVANSNYGTARVGQITDASTHTITAPQVFASGDIFSPIIIFNPNNINELFIRYALEPGNDMVIPATTSAASITFGSPVSLGYKSSTTSAFSHPQDPTTFVYAYAASTGDLGFVSVGKFAITVLTNLTDDNFIGISTAAYTDAETATVMLQGGVSTNQSGLVLNSTYYVQEDGTLSTIADTISVIAGKALSATSLFLSNPNPVYDSTAIDAAVALNTAKVSNVDHPLVETAVPVGAVFTDTDTVYDSTAIDAAVALNTAKISNSTDASDLISGKLQDSLFPAVLPAISGANLTDLPTSGGGTGGTADFVASGTLPNGTPVILKADGSVEAVGIFSTPVVYENTGYATPTGQATAFARYIQCAPAGINKILVAFKDSNDLGKAVVGTISGTSITFGTPVEFAASSGSSSISMKGDPSTPGSFLVAYSAVNTTITVAGYMTDAVYHPEVSTPGYTVPEVASWVFQGSSSSHKRTGPNGANSGDYVSGPWWWNDAGTSANSGETTSTRRLTPRQNWQDAYWAVDPGPVYLYYVDYYVVTTAAYWVDPVVTQAAYTTPAYWTDPVVIVDETVYDAKATVLTVSGTTVTVGTEVAFNNETSYSQYQHGLTVDPSTAGRFMVAYGDVNNNTEVNIMQVSGTSITMGTPVILSVGSNVVAVEFNPHVAGQWIGVSKSSIADNYSYIGSVSGNTITVSGNSNLLTTTTSDSVHISFDPHVTNAGRFVIAYRDIANSNYGTARVGQITDASTHTITAPQVFASGDIFSPIIIFNPNNINELIIRYALEPSNDMVIPATTSAASITFGSPVSLGYKSSTSSAFPHPQDPTTFVYAYAASTGDLGFVGIGNFAITLPTNLTDDNFIGISTAAYTDAETATVMLQGGVSDNQSGLVLNSTYYVQEDGTLSTIADTISVIAGKALSATSLFLSNPNPVYDSTAIDAVVALNTAKVSNVDHPLVETAVPVGAVFTDTDTVYDSTAIDAAVALNTAKVSNIDHPLVETAVPVGAMFTDTDTVYTHPVNHEISVINGLQTALDSKATEAYVTTEVAALVDSSPATLDTLNELAAALGDDPNFATTMTNTLAGKVDDSQVLTDVPAGAVFTDTDTVYDSTAIDAAVALNTAKISNVDHPLVETAVPVGAVFTDTDTVYDSTAIDAAVALNTAKISNVDHPLVETAVPVGALFTDTDTIYDDSLTLVDSDAVSPVTPSNKLMTQDDVAGLGGGDMLKSVYDTNLNGIVDNAALVNGLTVETAVPVGAVFTDTDTDTIYDSTAIDAAVALNTAKVTNSTDASDLISGTLQDSLFPAVLPAIDGSLLTNLPTSSGGSGGTADFVASGVLPNGTPVILKADGTVEAVGITSTTVVGPMSIEPAVVFNSGSTGHMSIAFDPNTAGKFVIAYSDYDNASYGMAIVGTVSGTSISFGTEVVFNSDTSYDVQLSFDPNTAGKFIVAYRDQNNSSYGKAKVGTVSGTSISFGTAAAFHSGKTWYAPIAFDPNTAGKFVIAYSDGDNSDYGKAIVGTISGTSISFGTEVVFNSGKTNYISIAFDPNTAGKFVIVYRDDGNSDYGTAIVGTVSGTSISFGTEVVFNSGTSWYISLSFDPNTTGKFVIAYMDVDNSGYGTAIVGTVSGTTMTFGTEVVFNSGNSYYNSISFDPNMADKCVISYKDGGNSSYGTAIVGTVSGTSISFGAGYVFNSGPTAYISIAFDLNNAGKFVIAYRDQDNSNYGTAVLGEMEELAVITNLTADNFMGLSTAAYTDAETATVTLQGGVSSNQTDLTIGSNYYVQEDGTLATTAATPSVIAGKALSATSLLLNSKVVASHFHGATQTVTSGEATTNITETVDYTFSELSGANHYSVFLNRLLLRPSEYVVSGTTVTISIAILQEADEIEVTGFSS